MRAKRKSRKDLPRLLLFATLPVDIVMVLAAFVVAYAARSANTSSIPVIYIWPFEKYLRLALMMLPVWIIAFSFSGLYSQRRQRVFEFGQIITGSSLGAMALVLYVFFQRGDFFSRLIVLYVWALAIVFVGLGRAILSLIRNNIHYFGADKVNLAIIGRKDAITANMIEQIKARPNLGYNLSGVVSMNGPVEIPGIAYLGKVNYLEKIVSDEKIDEVILTDTNANNDDVFFVLRTCQEKNIVFKAVPAHAQVGARTLQYDEFSGVPIIEFQGTALQGWGEFLKRIIDIVVSLIGIIAVSPIMLILYLIIKLDSKGPAIYQNVRVGKCGEFMTYKFRTMHIEYCTGNLYGGNRAEKFEETLINSEKNIKPSEALYKITDDPRVTRMGRFLRKTSLDELPQLFNVFLGNMSLVGPRPHQPREVKNYTIEQRKLLLMKPGMTGLAQISGRSDLTFDDEARLDIFYLENWSIAFDFFIIIKTFAVVIRGKGGY